MNGMFGPAGLAAGVGVLMLAVTAVSIARIVGARITRTATDWAVDGCHAVMGVSMAGMLIPGLAIVEPGPSTWAWVIISALFAAGFAISVAHDVLTRTPERAGPFRRLDHLPHLVLSGAMVYMLCAVGIAAPSGAMTNGGMSGMSGMSGMEAGSRALPLPTLDIMFAFFMIGYAVLLIDRLPAIAELGGIGSPVALVRGSSGSLFAPRLAAAVSIVMATGMAYMLAMMFA